MIARVSSVALVGMDGHPIDVEVSIAQGLPAFTIVGLPDPSIQEARERVRSAVIAAGEKWPQKRITVNLSPAHLRKTGSAFDLAIAVGLLAAEGSIAPERIDGVCMLGELSLDGAVRPIRGMLPSAMTAKACGARMLIVPPPNAAEAALVRGIDVVAADHLARVVRHLRGEAAIDVWAGAPVGVSHVRVADVDLSDVRGNDAPKRALEIAAAGGHNMLMIGSAGAGKTMLARRLPGILPPMTEEESFEVTRVHSVAGLLADGAGLVIERPFRSPHDTSSTRGMVGGGSGVPRPGEVSLAHRGVLFLDELGEFRNETLQALRQPLEDGVVTIVRSKLAVTFPARFQLIAASNPCPCGNYGDLVKPCTCRRVRFRAYRERLSGPIVDRIDLQVAVPRLQKDELFCAPEGEPSESVAVRVAQARSVQRQRAPHVRCNAELPPRDLERAVKLEPAGRRRLEREVELRALSARGAHRIMRVARTIADLDGRESVDEPCIVRAMEFRVLDVTGDR